MATMILLPDSDVSNHPNWVAVGATDNWDCLKDDNGNTSYVKASTDTAPMVIGFADPDDVTPVNDGVAEADVGEVLAVQFLSHGRSNNRRNAALVDIAFQTPSGFSESCSYDPHASSHEQINGTTRLVRPDGEDWEYSDLENIAMICTKLGTEEVYLGYLALKILYNAPVIDNATFFGANF